MLRLVAGCPSCWCSRERTPSLRRHLTELVESLAIEVHLGTALGHHRAKAQPWRLGVLSLTYPYALSGIFIRQCQILWSALRYLNGQDRR